MNAYALPRLFRSLTLRQWYSVKNRLFQADPSLKHTRFHSQFGEDRYIHEHLDLPKHGVFVDVGAGHPIHLSNTYFFEMNGWAGVCIDADPKQYEVLKKQRANVEWAAIATEEGQIELSQAYFPTYSSTVKKTEYKGLMKVPFIGTISVPSFRLETILKKHKIDKIDILSIDVEGIELDVWKTFDHDAHKPAIVIMEYSTFGLADNSKKIKDCFSSLPYKLIHTTCTNFIFRRIDS